MSRRSATANVDRWVRDLRFGLGFRRGFEIGRFGTPKGRYFEIYPSIDKRAAGAMIAALTVRC
jgi:hypothetical protein